MTTTVIKSDDDAFALLERLTQENRQWGIEDLSVEFDGWPSLRIYAKGDRYKQTISPAMMKSFLALQTALYRSYALARYSSPNVNKLTKQEKEDLEISVKVEDGSSDYSVMLQKFAEQFLSGALGKMNGDQVTLIIISAMVLFCSHVAIKHYLENRRQIRSEEINAETQKEHLSVMATMSQEETKRMQLMQSIAVKNPIVDNIQKIAYDTTMDVLRGLETAETSDFQGVPLDAERARLLVQNARTRSDEIRLDGKYRIFGVDSSLKSDFKLKVLSLDSHDEFVAQVQEKDLTQEAMARLQEAEWQRRPIMLHINARELHGEIRKAVIVKVGVVDPQQED